MTRPVVLHVIPSQATGGAERMLALLATAQRVEPISSVIAVIQEAGDGEIITAPGVPIFNLGMRHPLHLPMSAVRLARLIRQMRPVAIQSWLYYADLLALLALELSGLRASTRLHWGVRCSSLDLGLYSSTLRWTIAACVACSARPDTVVANSLAGRDAHRALGYKPRAFPVIHNGVDTNMFRTSPAERATMRAELGIANDVPVVIHVARVDPMKDHRSLIQVARALPQVTFLAAGAGTEALDGPSNLITLGVRRDLSSLYQVADLALSTSSFGEGFSNVIGEAMACGVPVIATDVGDAAIIIADTGAIVPIFDTEAMIRSIRDFLDEAPVAKHARREACRHRIVANFSLERAVAAFDQLHLHSLLPPEPLYPARTKAMAAKAAALSPMSNLHE